MLVVIECHIGLAELARVFKQSFAVEYFITITYFHN